MPPRLQQVQAPLQQFQHAALGWDIVCPPGAGAVSGAALGTAEDAAAEAGARKAARASRSPPAPPMRAMLPMRVGLSLINWVTIPPYPRLAMCATSSESPEKLVRQFLGISARACPRHPRRFSSASTLFAAACAAGRERVMRRSTLFHRPWSAARSRYRTPRRQVPLVSRPRHAFCPAHAARRGLRILNARRLHPASAGGDGAHAAPSPRVTRICAATGPHARSLRDHIGDAI